VDEKIRRTLVLLSDDMSISFMRLQAILDNHRPGHVKADDELLEIAVDLYGLANRLEALATLIKAAD
jgi:hypothetical protein